MRKLTIALVIGLSLMGKAVLYAQTHTSVPLDHAVYYILNQAENRGLCAPLPLVKPYTKGRVVEAINEILGAEAGRFGALTEGERIILRNFREEFTRGAAGLDLKNGMYRFDITGKRGTGFLMDVGLRLESLNSGAFYLEEKKPYLGTDTWGTVFVRGDIGKQFSFNADVSGGLMKAERALLGRGNTLTAQTPEQGEGSPYQNQNLPSYSQALAFFPYSYSKNYDGFIFPLGNYTSGSMDQWPQDLSIGPRMLGELSASIFDDMLLVRFARIRREWGGMAPGSSLDLNAAARPFTGIEVNFNPVSWFAFSSLTGALEFDNELGITEPGWTFQNAYSIQQLELNYKNYVHLDLGATAVWSKRFELGYLFPLVDNFIAQNLVGNFDNIAVYLNLRGRYPGLGSIWFSAFGDEIEVSSAAELFERDRHMFAYQAGLQGIIPGLPFTSLTVSYTKNEPYNYTHPRIYVPWYNNSGKPIQTHYVNNGVSLGHYIPPNSDEIKVRFDTRPWQTTAANLQYQLIRHGADYGPHQVDGSSLISEMYYPGIDNEAFEKATYAKRFLKDGAYQWMHIIKIGAEHTLKNFPLTLFGEAGVVYSHFTDISDSEYAQYTKPLESGNEVTTPGTGEYRASTALILTLGFKIFK